jgi:hypothetical protein
MTKDEALRLALEALIEVRDANIHGLTLTQDYHETITAIKAALEAKDEPVIDESAAQRIATALGWEPQRTWVGLTDEEIWDAYMKAPLALDCSTDELYAISRTVEAKLKEKNHDY